MASEPAPITTVVFDLGGVLIDWNPRYLYRTVFDDEEQVEWFLTHICTLDWNEQQDAGRSIEEGVALLSARHPEYANAIALYYDRWEEMVGGAFDETVALLEQLDERGLPLYALTNWSAETFPYTMRFAFMSRFRDIVVSGREGIKKPDPRIYRLVLDRFGLDAEHTLFIDDSSRNVKGAAELGFQTVHFQSADLLGEALSERGLM